MDDNEIYEDKKKIAKFFAMIFACTLGLYLMRIFVAPYSIKILILLPMSALLTLYFGVLLVMPRRPILLITPEGIQRIRLIGKKFFPWNEVGNVLITHDGGGTQVRVQSRVKEDFIELDERFLPGTAEEMRSIIIEYQKTLPTLEKPNA